MRPLKKMIDWFDERLEIGDYIKKEVLDHPIPTRINLSFCFGGITFFLFVMLLFTGLFMTFYYVASPEQSYDAVDYMTFEVPMGQIIRSVHHWSANLIMVTIFIHMIRVYVYGAYKKPRDINWVTGVVLFLMIMGFGFTGYLLPWDQKAYWATKVGTNMAGTVPLVGDTLLRLLRGGTDLGALTLTRFYAVHIMFLPLLTIIFLVGHFFMIRRHGIARPL